MKLALAARSAGPSTPASNTPEDAGVATLAVHLDCTRPQKKRINSITANSYSNASTLTNVSSQIECIQDENVSLFII